MLVAACPIAMILPRGPGCVFEAAALQFDTVRVGTRNRDMRGRRIGQLGGVDIRASCPYGQ